MQESAPSRNAEPAAPLRALIAAGRVLSSRGWTPATSGNLSLRDSDGIVYVTASGRDKGALVASDVLRVDAFGRSTDGTPSAETALHLALYAQGSSIGAVVHVHSVNATVLSRLCPGALVLEGYEIAKAFAGVTSHATTVTVPVFDNDQDTQALAARIAPLLDLDSCAPGYLLRGHGLYAWGCDLAEALRHVEAFDFLFTCEIEHRRMRP